MLSLLFLIRVESPVNIYDTNRGHKLIDERFYYIRLNTSLLYNLNLCRYALIDKY